MKRIAFGCSGSVGEAVVTLLGKNEGNGGNSYVVTWKLLEYGEPSFLVSLVDTYGKKHMTECTTMNDDGGFSCEFKIVTDSDERYAIEVLYYEEVDRVFIDVTEG